MYLKISAGGVNTPAWLMPQVKTFSFIDPATLETLTIPVFWDEAFLAKKFRMIAVMGQRFASHPAVRASVVSCANAKTDDWNVPHTRADIQNWQKVGYTTEKLIDVCKTTIAKVAEAFPNQYVVLPVASNNRLDPEPHYVASTVADWALATYPGRFFVARHSLSAITPDPAETMDLNHWSVIYERRPNVAGQMLWSATYDPDCTMNGGVPPCDPAVVLQEAVKIGSRYGLRFVEIYSQDITNPDLKAIIDLASSLY